MKPKYSAIEREAFARGLESAARHLRREVEEDLTEREAESAEFMRNVYEDFAVAERAAARWCDRQARKVRKGK